MKDIENKKVASNPDELTIADLEKQLNDEIGLEDEGTKASAPVEASDENAEIAAIMKEANDFLTACGTELPDDKGDNAVLSEEEKVLGECKEVEAKIASIEKSGIEDEIGDQVKGGEPSVSELAKTKIDCDTKKDVIGKQSDSEYVASITQRLDRVANALEKRGMRRMAFRIDQLSDRLEASVKKN